VVKELKWTRESDAYSFGVLAYEIVSGGTMPFYHLADEALITFLSSLLSSSSDDSALAQALFANVPMQTPLCVWIISFAGCGR
jgi:hypothetical protein